MGLLELWEIMHIVRVARITRKFSYRLGLRETPVAASATGRAFLRAPYIREKSASIRDSQNEAKNCIWGCFVGIRLATFVVEPANQTPGLIPCSRKTRKARSTSVSSLGHSMQRNLLPSCSCVQKVRISSETRPNSSRSFTGITKRPVESILRAYFVSVIESKIFLSLEVREIRP